MANKPVNTPNSGNGTNPMPLESPRNQKYQQTNEFDIYSTLVDKQLNAIKTIQEASATNKAS